MQVSQRSLLNLVSVKPGEVRNPEGRGGAEGGRASGVSKRIKALLFHELPINADKDLAEYFPNFKNLDATEQNKIRRCYLEKALAEQVTRAAGGDLEALKFVLDEIYGKQVEKREIKGSMNLSGMESEELSEMILGILDEKGKGTECPESEPPAPPKT